MLVLVQIAHVSPDVVTPHVEAHRAYLASLHEAGKLVAAGPLVPRTGGIVLLEVASEAEASAIVARDPYRIHGVAVHEMSVWNPTLGTLAASRRLAGRVALVTGASSGIGEAVAVALAREGASLALVARRIERLEALAARLPGAVPIAADVTRDDGLVDRVVGRLGRLDIVVNNAGVMLNAPLAEATADEWRRMIELNLVSAMRITQAAVAAMRSNGGGHIVNIASLAGRIANPGASAYAATKFGIVGFSEAVRREVYAQGIRVTVIEPGVVATELGANIANAGAREAAKARAASMRVLDAEDVAAAVTYAVTQPAHVNVNEIVVRPTAQER